MNDYFTLKYGLDSWTCKYGLDSTLKRLANRAKCITILGFKKIWAHMYSTFLDDWRENRFGPIHMETSMASGLAIGATTPLFLNLKHFKFEVRSQARAQKVPQ